MATQDFFSKHWLAGVLILLFVLNGIWMVRMSGELTPPDVGREAPDFELGVMQPDGDGGQARTLSLADLRGKVVVIDFWAPWCAPCVEAIPELVALQRDFKDRGVAVVGVATSDSPPEDVARVVREEGIRYPVLADLQGKVADRYKVDTIPRLVVIDRQGVIREVADSPMPAASLARLIRPYL